MSKIIGIILLVAAVFVISLVWKTAPANNLLSSNPSETAAPQTNVSTNYSTNYSPYSAPSGGTTISAPSKPEATPLNQRVRISSANISGYPLQYSHITLYSSLKKGETIDITGWKIKSNKSEATIPQAIEIYDLSGYSVDGDIILKQSNYVDLYSLSSPVNKNLRLNKCSGYLAQSYNFGPVYLSSGCPRISSSEIRNLSGQCQSYIQSLGSCRTPDLNFSNSLPGNDEGNACRAFLQNIGYASCVSSHRNDADFLSNNWIVWLYGQITLDPQHDYLRLYNASGDLMSEYSY
ncbi:MAG: hypothetical protein Q8N22_00430 [bacterium]|nr:hypothetical protein [bacterium]